MQRQKRLVKSWVDMKAVDGFNMFQFGLAVDGFQIDTKTWIASYQSLLESFGTSSFIHLYLEDHTTTFFARLV